MNGDFGQVIGSIGMFAGNFSVRNYAFCAGQLIAISQNTALFSILGDNYGGDARATFGIPDLRGRIPTGVSMNSPTVDDSLSDKIGIMGGFQYGNLPLHMLANHSHTFSYGSSSSGGSSSCSGSLAVAKDGTDAGSASSGSHLSDGPIKAGSFSVSNLYKDGATAFENLDVKVSCSEGGPFDPTKVMIGLAGTGTKKIESFQPYIVINYEIAVEGLYPSRN